MRDLEGALRRDPELIGALEPIASELLATGCRAAVDGATGKAQAAYDELKAARLRTCCGVDVSADDFRRRFRADRGDSGTLDG